jgi:hypothetical protein
MNLDKHNPLNQTIVATHQHFQVSTLFEILWL